MSGMTTYETAGRRFCKTHGYEYVSSTKKGCTYKDKDEEKFHKWDSIDEKSINFSYYGSRGL